MGWVVLFSTSLGFASDSERLSEEIGYFEEAKHLNEDKDGNDLSPLHSAICDEYRGFLECKGHDAKYYRYLLRFLPRYLLGIPTEKFSDAEDFDEYSDEEHAEEEDSYNKERNEKHCDLLRQEENSHNDETNDESDDESIDADVTPIARHLKARFTLEELRRMNIDFKKLLEIELLFMLPKLRPYTPEEESLLEAIWVLDCSPEQYLLIAIDSAAEDPEKALKTVKLIIETEDVDVNLPYKGFYLKRSSFLRKAAAVPQNKGLEIVRFLLDHGADIDLVDDFDTALHTAVVWENTEVIKLLLEHGANVNLKTRSLHREGWTPLHFALYFEDFEIAKVLLDYGVDPNIRDDDGKTPFDLAMEKRKEIEDETERQKFDKALNELYFPTS
jgi:hypothetical protein